MTSKCYSDGMHFFAESPGSPGSGMICSHEGRHGLGAGKQGAHVWRDRDLGSKGRAGKD